MKRSLVVLILTAGLLSCKDDEASLLTPKLVEKIKMYDLDNNGNASDIRLSFKVKDNLNVIAYRVMIIPSNQINSFDEGMALSIPSTSYIEVAPESFKTEHSFHRLSSSLLDVNGAQIQNEVKYVAVVYVIGTGDQQLSEFSTPLILEEQGIYSGRYFIGGSDVECTLDTTAPSWAADGTFFIDLRQAGEVYTGELKCPGCETGGGVSQGIVTFSVVGTTISDYVRVFPDAVCLSTLCDPEKPCPINEEGTGNVIDELIIEIPFTLENCFDNICTGTNIFVRQG